MAKYALKRILLLIPTLLIVCIIVFALMRMVPGDAVDNIVAKYEANGIFVDEATIEEQLGLDKPAVQQFFIWLSEIVRLDLGESFFKSEPVWDIIAREMPVTIELAILIVIFANVISIPLGLLCAARSNKIVDYVIRVIAILLLSVPLFWIATLVLIYPAKWWGYAPPTQYVSFFKDPLENLRMFVVPALLGSIGQAGNQIRTIRTLTLETLNQDYIQTCWSKGLKERRVLFRHAFKNSMIPTITIIGGSIAGLIGGSVILETMFSIPGIGNELITALNNRDYPLVQGCVLFLSVIVMLINLIVDLLYKVVDPRVELE